MEFPRHRLERRKMNFEIHENRIFRQLEFLFITFHLSYFPFTQNFLMILYGLIYANTFLSTVKHSRQ